MRILGVDLGERRIGLALSDSSAWLATPLAVIAGRDLDSALQSIAELVRKHSVGELVVGYPRSLDGTVGPQAQRVERAATKLRARVAVPVILWDERLSTVQAERLFHETGRRARRDEIDAAAAAVILQSYLDTQRVANPAGDSFPGVDSRQDLEAT